VLSVNNLKWIDALLGLCLGLTVTYMAVLQPWWNEEIEETVAMNVRGVSYENGLITLDRTVFEPFEATWSVAVLGTECLGTGHDIYTPGERKVQIFTFIDYVGDDDFADCVLDPGEYILVSHWDPVPYELSEEFDISRIVIEEEITLPETEEEE